MPTAFDVVATAAIFEELIKRARWSELVQWSGEPAVHTRFHFGKYHGKRYDEFATSDPDYLRAGSLRNSNSMKASSTARGIGLARPVPTGCLANKSLNEAALRSPNENASPS